METTQWFADRAFFQNGLVMGTECERNTLATDDQLARALKSNRQISKYWGAQTWHLCHDGTTQGNGQEIVLNAQRWNFAELHSTLADMERKLNQICPENTPAYCPSASNHISLLIRENRKIDPLIIKNLFNLTKAYCCGLHYLTSANPNRISRPSAYGRFAQAHWAIDAEMHNIQALIRDTGKYSMCNIAKLNTAGQNIVTQFFVEFRVPDGIRVPSALAGLMFLHKAMCIYAVDLARDGYKNPDQISATATDGNLIYNNLVSTQGRATDEVKEFCRRNAKELIDKLANIIKCEADGDKILGVLYKLAERNVSDRYGSTATLAKNDQIEKDLLPKISRAPKLTAMQQELLLFITFNPIPAADNTAAQKWLAEKFGCGDRTIRYAIMGIEAIRGRPIKFDPESKRYIMGVEG